MCCLKLVYKKRRYVLLKISKKYVLPKISKKKIVSWEKLLQMYSVKFELNSVNFKTGSFGFPK